MAGERRDRPAPGASEQHWEKLQQQLGQAVGGTQAMVAQVSGLWNLVETGKGGNDTSPTRRDSTSPNSACQQTLPPPKRSMGNHDDAGHPGSAGIEPEEEPPTEGDQTVKDRSRSPGRCAVVELEAISAKATWPRSQFIAMLSPRALAAFRRD